MKLIGSVTEQRFREQLLDGRRNLLLRGACPNLLKALLRHFPEMHSAFILAWTAEQGEDIYRVMVDDRYIATAEITRDGYEVRFDLAPIIEYQKSLESRVKRIQLAVALDLYAKSPRPTL